MHYSIRKLEVVSAKKSVELIVTADLVGLN